MPNGAEAPKRGGLLPFLAGHSLSAMGSRMLSAALLWHVYVITESAVALGSLAAVELVPMLLVAGPGGVIVDRLDRRLLLGVTQALQALPALFLAAVTFSGQDSVLVLYLAAALGSTIQTVDAATRKAIVPRLVLPRDLSRALSAMDLVKNLAKLAGPALMGLMVAAVGLAPVYLLTSLSYAAMMLALVFVPAAGGVASQAKAGLWGSVAEGIRFVRGTPVVWSLLVLDFLATFLAGAEALLPLVADRIIGVGPAGYGVLSSAAAMGALGGGALLLAFSPQRRLGRVVLGSAALFGLATIAFGLANSFVTCFVALVLLGAADTVSTVLRNTVLQLRTPDALLGRVSAVGMVFSKSGPRLGQLEAGLVAGAFGVSASIISGGVLCLAAVGAIAWWFPRLRELDGMEEPGVAVGGAVNTSAVSTHGR